MTMTNLTCRIYIANDIDSDPVPMLSIIPMSHYAGLNVSCPQNNYGKHFVKVVGKTVSSL